MTKEELRSYRDLRREAKYIERTLRRLEAEIYSPKTTRMDAMPRACPDGAGPTERLALKHMELLDLYREKLAELREGQLQVEKAIEPLAPTERMLMRFRYIDGMTWEGVADVMGYTERQVHRIHGKALAQIK